MHSDDLVGLVEYIRGMLTNRPAAAMQEPTLLENLTLSAEEDWQKLLEKYSERNPCVRAALTGSKSITDFAAELSGTRREDEKPEYYVNLERGLRELIPEQTVDVLVNASKYTLKSRLFQIGAYASAALPFILVAATHNKHYNFNEYAPLLFTIPFFITLTNYCLTEEKIGCAQAKAEELDSYIAAVREKIEENKGRENKRQGAADAVIVVG